MPSKMQGQVETHQKFNNIEFIVSATTEYIRMIVRKIIRKILEETSVFHQEEARRQLVLALSQA